MMKITRVALHLLSLPLPRPVRTAIHDIPMVDTVLLEVETDLRFLSGRARSFFPTGRGSGSA